MTVVHDANVALNNLEYITLHINDDRARNDLVHSKSGAAYFFPRGERTLPLPDDTKVRNALLRRFYLVGETLESAQVFEIRCAIRALRNVPDLKAVPLRLDASRAQAVNALYASLFESNIVQLNLKDIPRSHAQGPALLSVLKFMDIPQAAAMAAERTHIILHDSDLQTWKYPLDTANALGWAKDTFRGFELKQ